MAHRRGPSRPKTLKPAPPVNVSNVCLGVASIASALVLRGIAPLGGHTRRFFVALAKAAAIAEATPAQAATQVRNAVTAFVDGSTARANGLAQVLNAALALDPVDLTKIEDRVRQAVPTWNDLTDDDRAMLLSLAYDIAREAKALGAFLEGVPLSILMTGLEVARDRALELD